MGTRQWNPIWELALNNGNRTVELQRELDSGTPELWELARIMGTGQWNPRIMGISPE